MISGPEEFPIPQSITGKMVYSANCSEPDCLNVSSIPEEDCLTDVLINEEVDFATVEYLYLAFKALILEHIRSLRITDPSFEAPYYTNLKFEDLNLDEFFEAAIDIVRPMIIDRFRKRVCDKTPLELDIKISSIHAQMDALLSKNKNVLSQIFKNAFDDLRPQIIRSMVADAASTASEFFDLDMPRPPRASWQDKIGAIPRVFREPPLYTNKSGLPEACAADEVALNSPTYKGFRRYVRARGGSSTSLQ